MSYNEDLKFNRGEYNPNGYPNGGYNPGGGYNPNGGYNNGYNNGGRPPKPDNYLVWAILVTILCCLPFGIVAIIYSVQTDSAYNAGDYDGAYRNSGKAKTWCIVSAVASLAVNIIFIAIYGVAIFAFLADM